MKKYILISGGVLSLIFVTGFSSLYIWIDNTAKSHIEQVKAQYPGTAEDALIAFLLDDKNSPNDKTHIAVWTLGQIHSVKALPILKKMFQNDPEGETCYGKHDAEICQYELYKAIEEIEGPRFLTHARLNK